MERKSRQQRAKVYLIETKGQVRRAVKRDIEVEIKKRMKALEKDVIMLQDAMRGPN